jgi:hypothetical protein
VTDLPVTPVHDQLDLLASGHGPGPLVGLRLRAVARAGARRAFPLDDPFAVAGDDVDGPRRA